MNGIFELKRSLSNYSEIWDVNTVLDYLKSLGDPTTLLLKNLTLKTTILLCLLTGQRCQTIFSIDLRYIQAMENRFRITIQQGLKQSKAGRHLEPIELMAFHEDKRVCIVEHLKEYIQQTKEIRNQSNQLLICYIKPHKPVSKDTIARWVKEVLNQSGIDT